MLLRWVGAIIFGIMGDYMGRKYPMIINCFLMGILQVATIYSTSIASFLATRALFGIAMGGLWGLSASTAMEQSDVEARGILSGIFECGASAGFIAAAAINLKVGDEPSSWTISFWASACEVALMVLRLTC
jgi:MFS family permease